MPTCWLAKTERRQRGSRSSMSVEVRAFIIAEESCLDCGKENTLDQKSVIRCIVCGHRIFYKKRERKLLQYEAR